VPIEGEARYRREARGDRGVARDDATAVEALAENHIVHRHGVEIGGRGAHDVLRQLVGVGVPQRALHGGADGRTQGRHDDGVRHGCSVSYENAILSVRECELQEGEPHADFR
jgi:hypothetical protein